MGQLAETLIQVLHARFPGRGLRVVAEGNLCAVFPAAHPEVGDILIYDDGNEFTVELGRFTHGHFGIGSAALPEGEHAERAAEEVVEFLEPVFADEVVFWGGHDRPGGYFRRESGSRWRREGEPEYVWSGPLREAST
jgi:hypothetical protein